MKIQNIGELFLMNMGTLTLKKYKIGIIKNSSVLNNNHLI